MKNRLFFFLIFLFGFQLNAQSNGPDLETCPELSGRIVLPTDHGYEKGRLVSNFYSSKNKFPDVIVYCQDTQDVQDAVKWARCRNVAIRVRSGGHNHEAFSTETGVLIIDVSEMKHLHINKKNNTIIVQPGLTGGELYNRLYEVGLTQVGGTCSDVGISGLVLTGGMGPLYRRHGLSCDSLIALEMVDAKGNIIFASKDNAHKDLFWACCGGGGGNFGIVVLMHIQVYPASPVTWFNIGWNWDQPVEKIIATWQDLFSNDDKKWFSHLDLWSKAFQAEKFKKQPLKALGVFWGTPEEARQSLAPLLSLGQPADQTIEPATWKKAIQLFEDSTSVFITEKPEYKSTGAFAMEKIPEEGIRKIVNTLKNTPSPLLNVLFFSMGKSSVGPKETAYYYRDAKYFLSYNSQWLREADDQRSVAELDTLRNSLLPFTTGDYVGNPDRSIKDYMTAYYGGNVEKLQEIKQKYDPENFFKFEQSIRPNAGQ
ncbi:MAG: FAD-dependent oxidoreductase [Candidatus Protochlamydia sp.]|nr:FAD-dependent oxidoreductase [Candidatus Protochlamydia sp.]